MPPTVAVIYETGPGSPACSTVQLRIQNRYDCVIFVILRFACSAEITCNTSDLRAWEIVFEIYIPRSIVCLRSYENLCRDCRDNIVRVSFVIAALKDPVVINKHLDQIQYTNTLDI